MVRTVASISGSGTISNCLFEDLSSHAVAISEPTPNCQVDSCTFNNVFVPVSVNWSPALCDVSNCQMDGGRVGVSFAGGGSGSVSNCTIRNFDNYGIGILDGGEISITNNTIDQTDGWGMAMGGAVNAVIRQNTISTQTGKCLFLSSPNNGMVFESNDLFRGDGEFAQTADYWPYFLTTIFHLENNYWGTTNSEEISAHIQDGNYYENCNMFVLFQPFEGGPVPTEKTTFDALKALFR